MSKKSDFLKVFKKKIIFITLVALLEAVFIIIAGTFSWIEGSKKGSANSDNCTVSAGSGLVFTGSDVSSGKISLSLTNSLEDCSSTDGRNFFFNTTGSLNKSTADVDSFTASSVFRQANESDKNSTYVSVDFNVTSIAESGEGYTPIYLDNSSYLRCTGTSLKPFRVSVNLNDGTSPVVLCPGVSKASYTRTSNAIASINDSGKASTLSVTSNAISKYWYNNKTPIAKIKNGESKRITLTIWLEGTDADCTESKVSAKDLDVNMVFTTAQNYSSSIKFVDYSPSQWVKNPSTGGKPVYMYAVDKNTIVNGDYKTGVSYLLERQSDNITYLADIPSTVKDVLFVRYDPDDEYLGYNIWNQGTMTSSDTNTFYSVGQGKEVDKDNFGYWVNSTCSGVVDLYFTDVNDAYKYGSINPNVLFNSTLYGAAGKGDSYGYNMCYAGTNSYNQSVYHMIVPADATISFNGHGHTSQSINLKNSGVSQSAFTKSGYYCKDTGYVNLGWWDPNLTW